MKRDSIDSVIRSLRRVNLQGSVFGQTVAIRFGLSESDIETLEALIEMGASTAGRLADLTGLTSGAVTRVIDRLEQSGYVRRVPDPADRRRVIVEVVPEKVAADPGDARPGRRGERRGDRPLHGRPARPDHRLPHADGADHPDGGRPACASTRTPRATAAQSSEHSAPLGGLTGARLHVRSGLSELRLRAGRRRRRPLPGAVPGRDAAGPAPRRPGHRPVPRHPVRLAQADGGVRPQRDGPVDVRDRRRRRAGRGRPSRDRRRGASS